MLVLVRNDGSHPLWTCGDVEPLVNVTSEQYYSSFVNFSTRVVITYSYSQYDASGREKHHMQRRKHGNMSSEGIVIVPRECHMKSVLHY